MTAGEQRPRAAEGVGGIGEPGNFLEITVNADGGPLGVLNAFDTNAATTQGVFLTQTVGDMEIDTVTTKGDVSLVTRRGSLVDARNGGAGDDAANVIGNTIDLKAVVGDIGDKGGSNDLEIDSSATTTAVDESRPRPTCRRLPSPRPLGVRRHVVLGADGIRRQPPLHRPRERALRRGSEPAARRRRRSSSRRAAPEDDLDGRAYGRMRLSSAGPASRRQRHDRPELEDPRRPVSIDICGDFRRIDRRDGICGDFTGAGARPDRHRRSRRRHGHAPRRRDHAGRAELAAELHHADLRQRRQRPVLLRPDVLGGKTRAYGSNTPTRSARARCPARAASTLPPATARISSSSTSCRR